MLSGAETSLSTSTPGSIVARRLQAAHEQAGGNQQQQRQRDLADHQDLLEIEACPALAELPRPSLSGPAPARDVTSPAPARCRTGCRSRTRAAARTAAPADRSGKRRRAAVRPAAAAPPGTRRSPPRRGRRRPPPPMSDNSTLSVSSCRTSRERLAPSASRTATSRRRAEARDSSRFAMLAQAINSTAPTTPPSSSAADRIGSTLIVTCPLPGSTPKCGCSGPDGAAGVGAAPAGNCVRTNSDATLSSCGAGLLDAGAWLQPADRADPAVGGVLQQVRILISGIPGPRRPHDRLHHHRHVEAASAPDRRSVEPRRRHADDGEDVAVQPHLPPDDIRFAGEPRLPEVVADHRHGMRARRHIVGRRQQPSARRGTDVEDVEEVAGDDQAVHQFGRVAGVEAGADAAPAGQAVEVLVVVAQGRVHRIGEHAAVAAGDIGEAGRVADPQALEQRGVDQAEDRGVGADAQRQGQHGGHGEAGLPAQHAGGVAQILERVRDPPRPGAPAGNRRRHVRLPQRRACSAARVSWSRSSSRASRRASASATPSARSAS